MDKGVKKIFNDVAERYDKERNKLIPFIDIYYGTARDLTTINDEKGKILDLGAGTGLLTQWIFEKYPTAQYTLIDIADEMLDIAKERFKNYKNINYMIEDYRDGIKGGKYNAIISSLSIHHLDSNEKCKLYKNIYDVLEDGGVFVNADQVLGEDEESEEIVKAVQLNYIENSSLSREAKDETYERLKLDKMDKCSVQIEMLKEAGFTSVDIYYKYYNYIVFRCRK